MKPVFLSYCHTEEDKTHRARVLELGTRLREAGLSVVLDQFAQEEQFSSGGPNEGWPDWSIRQASNEDNRVLIMASPEWFSAFSQGDPEHCGATSEAAVIRQRIHINGCINPDIRIVSFESLDLRSIPLFLQGYEYFTLPAGFEKLVRWLKGTAPAATLDWPETPPSLDGWLVANHSEVREAVGRLLTRSTNCRFLPISGQSTVGKTLITNKILGSALRMPWLACGRFDFKGTAGIDFELRKLVQHLPVPLPPTALSLRDRLGHVLGDLDERRVPTLMIFDTYEAAGDTRHWVEEQLLPRLVRAEWLRIVIAGQNVPKCVGALTSNACSVCTRTQLTFPTPQDWVDYAHAHNKVVTLEVIREVYKYCNGNPSILAALCAPT